MTMPLLTVTIRREGRVCVLAVSGELDIATHPVLARQAAAALRQPAERLIIDLSGLEFIDCCGARALAALTYAAPAGCPVLVRRAGGRVRRVLDLLAVPLERPGTAPLDRGEWLILESQMVRSMAQETRADSTALAAEARQARARLAAICGSTRLAADLRAHRTGHRL